MFDTRAAAEKMAARYTSMDFGTTHRAVKFSPGDGPRAGSGGTKAVYYGSEWYEDLMEATLQRANERTGRGS